MRAQCTAGLKSLACRMQRVGVRRELQDRVCACFLERRRQWRQHPAALPPATLALSSPRPGVQALRPPPCGSWQAGAALHHGQAAPAAAAAAACHTPRRAATHAASSSSSSGGYGPSPTDSDSGYLDLCASSSQGWLLDSASDLWDTSLTSDITSSAAGGSYDAIMMLGGGLLPGGGLPEWVVRRLEGCLHLYREQAAATARGLRDDAASVPAGAAVAGAAAEQQMDQEQLRRQWRPWAPERPSGACPIVLLGAGTPHKPPVIDEAGFVLHESTAYAAYLMRRGVPAGDLLKECQSYDTVGNGFFSLFMHALPANWRRIAVVTSEFHMPRTQATFDFIYGLAGQQLHGDPRWFRLDFRPVSDAGIFDGDVLEARRAKEAAAVAAWHRNMANIRTLADLHSWLYATHLCYSVSRQHEFGRERDLDPKLAATY